MLSFLKKFLLVAAILFLPICVFAANTTNTISSITVTCPTQIQIANATKNTGTGIYAGAKLYITTIKVKNGLGWISYYQNKNALDNLKSGGTISSKKAGPRLQQVICTYGKVHIVAGVSLPSTAYGCQQHNSNAIVCE